MEVALRHGDERIWVKKFWSKLFFISESFESLIPMCFTRNGAVKMGENERNLFLILKKILKVPRRKKVFREVPGRIRKCLFARALDFSLCNRRKGNKLASSYNDVRLEELPADLNDVF